MQVQCSMFMHNEYVHKRSVFNSQNHFNLCAVFNKWSDYTDLPVWDVILLLKPPGINDDIREQIQNFDFKSFNNSL